MTKTARQALAVGHNTVCQLAPCHHYAGNERFVRKAFALWPKFGSALDITLDCEDGAAIGDEVAHAEMLAGLVLDEACAELRPGVRCHRWGYPALADELETLLRIAGERMRTSLCPRLNRWPRWMDWLACLHIAA